VRLTRHTDYALRMLIYAALRPNRICTVDAVATAYGLSRNHLLKVAQSLRDLGYVITARGRAGGIRLAVPPERINIGALVRAIEQDFALVECLEPGCARCRIVRACRLKGMVVEATNAFHAVLDRYSLADIIHEGPALMPLLGIDGAAA
jgi:Rrf2 family nitric oxide-sensitive transcriptional repressor